MTHCNCKSKHDWTGPVCNSVSPEYNYQCMKPDGHDGPHAACARHEHPVKVWDDTNQLAAQIKTAWRDADGIVRLLERNFAFHREDTGSECNFDAEQIHGGTYYRIEPVSLAEKTRSWVRSDSHDKLEEMR